MGPKLQLYNLIN